MKVRIHMLGGINLICDNSELNSIVAASNKSAKKNELIEIQFPGHSSKYLNPNHIIAIEEYEEPIPVTEIQA